MNSFAPLLSLRITSTSMKNPLKALLACAVFGTIPAAQTQADTLVHSLDQVRGAIKTRDARTSFDQQMGNAPEPDGFGTQLPNGFSKDWLAAQLAPHDDPRLVTMAGAKPWPQHPDMYVAAICRAASLDVAERIKKSAPRYCESRDAADQDFLLGVFTRTPDGTLRLIASTPTSELPPTSWRATNIDAPQVLDPMNGTPPSEGYPESWLRFDFAPYLLRENDYAFGVRAGWFEGYAGGGASFEGLYLLHIEGSALRVVFAQPMMFNKMIAGDWHKDGTRDHEVTDASNTLHILPSKTSGFHDLQLREQGGKWRQTFQWSAAEQTYVPKASARKDALNQ